MHRRQVIAGIATSAGVVLTGCTALQSDSSDNPSTDPDQNPFQFQATVVASDPSNQKPPVIQIKVTNTDSTGHTLTISNDAFPFATAEASTSEKSLILTEEIPSKRDGDCWTGYAKVLPRISGRKFSPKESVSNKYAVLNSKDNEDCWPTGSFEFTETYYLDPESATSTEEGTAFTWGFTVVVNQDGSIALEP